MTDRQILFSTPMVRALLEGRKSMTRRIIKLPHQNRLGKWEPTTVGGHGCFYTDGSPAPEKVAIWHTRTGDCICTQHQPGDRLWVRETWWHPEPYSYGTMPSGDEIRCQKMISKFAPVHYAADGDPPNCANRHYGPNGLKGGFFAAPDPYAIWSKRASIHMPRWASRLTLMVDDVKVERLQDVSKEDAWAEGVWDCGEKDGGRSIEGRGRELFESLWSYINGADSWEANPWVSATVFRTIKANIDTLDLANRPTCEAAP